MIYKCGKCGSEGDAEERRLNVDEWCFDCECERVKVVPEKRSYTHDLIFSKYLDAKCPICDGYTKADEFHSHTESGGKCVAKEFQCKSCHSIYAVGFNRSCHPILSEVIHNAVY